MNSIFKKTRITVLFLVLTLLVSIIVPSMSANAATCYYSSRAKDGTYVVANMSEYDCGVDVYSTANYNYASFATINANTAYRLVSETKDSYGRPWYKINYTERKTGYVCGYYTHKVTVRSNNYVISPSSQLNMRQGPSTGYSSMGKTKANTYYSLIGCNGENFTVAGTKWYQCMDGNLRVFWLKSTLTAGVKMSANVTCDVDTGAYFDRDYRFRASSNMRTGPGTSYAKVRSSSFGTSCVVYVNGVVFNTKKDLWYAVTVRENGRSYNGYVLGTLLK